MQSESGIKKIGKRGECSRNSPRVIAVGIATARSTVIGAVPVGGAHTLDRHGSSLGAADVGVWVQSQRKALC